MSRFKPDKKKRSVAENIIVVLLIGALMASFIHAFLKQEQELSHTGLSSLASSFTMKVLTIRAQWFMDDKPKEVIVSEYRKELKEELIADVRTELNGELSAEVSVNLQQSIPVNSRGWLDVEKGNICQEIWHYAIGEPLKLIKEPIAALEIQNNKANSTKITPLSICRYQLSSGWYFDYHRENGQISAVTK